MLGLPQLSTLILLPLLGCLFILFMRGDPQNLSRNARSVALVISLVTFVLSLFLWSEFDVGSGDFQFVEKYDWPALMGLSYHVGVDGVGLAFILLSTFVMPFALLSAFRSVTHNVHAYMACFLLLEALMIGTFCALDMVLFYVFFEGVLIPMFFIIGVWGGPRRIYASFKFFLYTLLGSVLMLVAIILLSSIASSTNLLEIYKLTLHEDMQKWLFLAFFASFAVKMPMWPVHTWLPDAHVEAPTAGSVILAAILLKMGGYGFLRFSLPLFPDAALYFAPMIFILSVVAVIYTSLVALVQKDMKKLIAYSSVAHMGFVTFGIFTFLKEGVQGALFQMLSHGFVSGALFMCIGVLYDRLHTREIAAYGGVVKTMPFFAVLFMIFTLAGLGLPGTSGFVGELMILIGAFKVQAWLAGLLGTGMILGAAYMLVLYRGVMFGPVVHEAVKALEDLSRYEKMALLPLVGATLFFGVYPKPLLELTDLAAERIIQPFHTPLTPQSEGMRGTI